MCLFQSRVTVCKPKPQFMWSSGEGKHAGVPFERCPAADNDALFHMKGRSVTVIIMTQGGAFFLTKLFYQNVVLALKKKHTFGQVTGGWSDNYLIFSLSACCSWSVGLFVRVWKGMTEKTQTNSWVHLFCLLNSKKRALCSFLSHFSMMVRSWWEAQLLLPKGNVVWRKSAKSSCHSFLIDMRPKGQWIVKILKRSGPCFKRKQPT